MNERQRFLATLTFQKPDHVPFIPGFGRRSTLAAWHQQGLPTEITHYHPYLRQLIGIPETTTQPEVSPGVDFRMVPQFEEKGIEHRPSPAAGAPGTLVVQDWKGNICE